MARGEREVKVTVLGDSKGGQRALAELNDKAAKTGNHFDGLGGKVMGFGKIAAIGLGGAATAVGGFMVKAVLSASDLGETLSKVGVVFGDAKDQVVADADFMAKSFGIPKQAFLDASASIGLIGKASGLAKDQVGPFSTGLARLATDASSFFNVPLEEALQAIQSGLTGEAEPLKKFGVLLNESAVAAEAAALGLGGVGRELTEGEKVQARASLITKGLADANGDLERTQGSLSNRLRELKGRAENFAAGVGEKVIPILLKFMDAGENLGKKLGPVFSVIGDGFRLLVGSFTGKGAEGAEGVGKMMNPIIDMGARLRAMVDDVVGWVKDNWPEIKRIITETLKTVQVVVKGVVDVITTIWENFGDQIMVVIKAAWTFVKATIDAALKVIQGIVKTVTSLIKGDWSGVWEGIKMILAGAWDFIVARVRLAIEIVKAVLSVAWEVIKSGVSGAWDGIKGVFASAWDGIKDLARSGVASIVDTFLGMVGIIIGAAERAFGWIPGIGGKVKEAARSFEEFRDRTNAALRGTDSDKTIRITTVYEDVYVQRGDRTYGGQSTAGISQYHTGGIVPGTGDVPIMAQGGEGVFTPEQMAVLGASIGRGGGNDGAGAGITINLNVGTLVGDGGRRELMQMLRSELLKYDRRVIGLLK